mgnify:CR=1 FL=1
MIMCPYCKQEKEKEKWSWIEVAHGSFGCRRYDGCHSCVSAISRKYDENVFWLGLERNLKGKKHTRLIREKLFNLRNYT